MPARPSSTRELVWLMGYTRFGEVDYEDEGQPHIWMEKTISRP